MGFRRRESRAPVKEAYIIAKETEYTRKRDLDERTGGASGVGLVPQLHVCYQLRGNAAFSWFSLAGYLV